MAYTTPDPPSVSEPGHEPTRPSGNGHATRKATHERVTTARVATAGTSFEVLAGAGAIVLAIIGLTGYLSLPMAAIATIAVGAGLLAEGGAIAARWSSVMRQVGARRELEGGIGAEMFAGIAGIVLGILALVHVLPMALLPIAAIVLGASVVFGGVAEPDLASLAHEGDTEPVTREMPRPSGAMMLAGVGAVVLGILALLHVGPIVTLSLAAMLAIGAALLLGGSMLTARFARRFAA